MKYILLFGIIFLSACSIKNYENSQSKIVIIKTQKLKFADLAYVRHTKDALEVEMFVAGRVVQTIAINHLVCVNDGCLSKATFNEEYLSEAYPDGLIQNVFLGRPIYDGINLLRNSDGFEQVIITKKVHIMYRVNSKEIFFKDRQNRIIFKIKDI